MFQVCVCVCVCVTDAQEVIHRVRSVQCTLHLYISETETEIDSISLANTQRQHEVNFGERGSCLQDLDIALLLLPIHQPTNCT